MRSANGRMGTGMGFQSNGLHCRDSVGVRNICFHFGSHFPTAPCVTIIDPENLVRLATAKGLAFVGVTATLFAIAMYKLPARHAPAAMAAKAADREKPWGVVVVFAFAAVVIGVIASLAYVVQLKAIEQHELQNLDTIARAHAARIGQWLNERRADIGTFARAKLPRTTPLP